MPQALAFPLAFAASNTAAALGASVATNAAISAFAASALATTLVSTALTVGASYAIAKLTAPPIPRPSDGSVEFKQPLPPRFFTYGHCKISGPVLLLETTDEQNLSKIVAFGTRELAAFERLYVDGNWIQTANLTPDATGLVLAAIQGDGEFWTSNARANLHIGKDNQAADPTALVTFLQPDATAEWTSAHRLRGIPYVYAVLPTGAAAEFQSRYPGGVPEFAVVGGVRVYDPRKDSSIAPLFDHIAAGYPAPSGPHRYNNPATWEFSDNQRLCTLDWILWKDGYNRPFNRIDWQTWIPQIYLADENVGKKAGGTEKRYRVATKVSYDEPRSRVLQRLMQAGDQQLFTTPAGKIGSRGGEWKNATVGLEVERFVEAFFTHGVPMMDRCNEFELIAMLPEKDYTEYDLPPYINASDPEHALGIIRRQPLDLSQVPSASQARRLAKIYMAKQNPRWSGQVKTSFQGLDAIGESTVHLTFDELDQPDNTFNGPFWVNGRISFLPDKTGITFPVASADPTAYDWNPNTDDIDIGVLAGIVLDDDADVARDEDELLAEDEGMASGPALLLETGDSILLEDGSGTLLMEG